MNFPFAITFILQRKKYTRQAWKHDNNLSWVELSYGILKTEDSGKTWESYTPTQDDMLATDWKELKV